MARGTSRAQSEAGERFNLATDKNLTFNPKTRLRELNYKALEKVPDFPIDNIDNVLKHVEKDKAAGPRIASLVEDFKTLVKASNGAMLEEDAYMSGDFSSYKDANDGGYRFIDAFQDSVMADVEGDHKDYVEPGETQAFTKEMTLPGVGAVTVTYEVKGTKSEDPDDYDYKLTSVKPRK
jgi:hypothetical protein